MARFIALLCSVLFLVCNISSKSIQKTCSDCVNLFSCPPAVTLFNENKTESHGQLVNSFCGYGDDKFPRVCCNELTNTAEDDDIENHPNLRLLPNICGIYDGQRIVGGKKAGIYEFPWMALISYRTRDGIQFQCGGTLINDRYILTAAHCINNLKIVGVRVGEFDIDSPLDCQGKPPEVVVCEDKIQDIHVEEAISHADYHGKPYVFNDIGLLRLKTPADFSHKNAAPICLPSTKALRSIDIGGKNATVTGWGATETGYASNELLKVQLPVHTRDQCKSYYNRGRRPEDPDITENIYCAGEFGKDSCKGDSGGPLIVDGVYQSGQRYIQYGIVSNGPIRCGSDFPGVYTNVSKYMKWILDHIKP